MRRRQVVAPFLKSASVAAALTACSVGAQAASVQTVFSAENALYGAGYRVGQADGWIDDSLRAAVTQYQTDRPGLTATGELDAPTLEALGISGSSSQLMGGNVVSNAEAARQELGLTVASAPKQARTPTPAPKAEPKPEPQPEREQPVATPEPVVEPAPVIASAPTVNEPDPQPEPQAAPKPEPRPKQVTKTPSEPAPKPTQSEPEPTSEPIKIASTVRSSSRDESAAAKKAEVVSGEIADTADTADTDNVASVANTESTKAAASENSTAARNDQESINAEASLESQPTDRQGNVITRMFNFLFGWMV